jgi:hypothetical protein
VFLVKTQLVIIGDGIMKKISSKGVIVGGCLDFKNPVGLSFSAMKGLTRELALSGHPNLHCEQSFDVPIDGSIGAPFYFYHIRKGAQEKDFVVGELRKMHLRPACLYESTSLASLGFSKLHKVASFVNPNKEDTLVQLVCLASIMIADDQRLYPLLKCRADRDMWVDGATCGENLPLDAFIPVTDRCFNCWNWKK